ncbi:hypothetical protein Pfo_021044 [Paulownia fortunei]|nr:hypothetical protein Pfo_021044 [Paulownia fortunei]
MESKNKKLKKNQEKEEERYDLDRLSCLPDSILTHILSFLDTKSAVRTSVLSKRYQLLWTLSPCLDFKLSEFLTESFDSYDGHVFSQVKNSSVVSFESYVNHVLQLREHSNLTMFRLSLHKDVGLEFMQNCVDYAAQHKVQHLRIRAFVKRKPVTLPKLLLTSSSLITLHLHNATSHSIELPKSVFLPYLKVLRLKNFEFSDKNFNGEVFSGCPSLETLVLSKCSIRPGNKLKILDVNCLNLKNLEIRYWRSPWKCFDEHMINVNAPRLAFFKFQGHLARVNFKEGLPCLEKACIDLCYPTACFMVNASERKQRTSESFLSMLRHICNVKFLSLSLKTIEKLTPECSKVKTKKDARHIAIPAHVMHFLLESSPSAEFLSVEIPKVLTTDSGTIKISVACCEVENYDLMVALCVTELRAIILGFDLEVPGNVF